MAQTLKDKITVSELSKYGVKVGQEYVNYGKQLSEAAKAKLVPGGTYDVELFVADSGKRYINSVGNVTLPVMKAPAPVADAPKTAFVPKAAAKKADSMSKDEWAAKDRSQLIGGLSHDAAALVAAFMYVNSELATLEQLVLAHKIVLEGLLQNREEVK